MTNLSMSIGLGFFCCYQIGSISPVRCRPDRPIAADFIPAVQPGPSTKRKQTHDSLQWSCHRWHAPHTQSSYTIWGMINAAASRSFYVMWLMIYVESGKLYFEVRINDFICLVWIWWHNSSDLQPELCPTGLKLHHRSEWGNKGHRPQNLRGRQWEWGVDPSVNTPLVSYEKAGFLVVDLLTLQWVATLVRSTKRLKSWKQIKTRSLLNILLNITI